jgi:hypothetical protein
VHPYTLRAFQWYQEWVGGEEGVSSFGRSQHNKQRKQGGVSHCGLAIYIKTYLNAKEELQKLQIFHHAKI